MKKKLLSILLVFVLVIGILPVSAFAAIRHDNDWEVFPNPNSAPETAINLARQMIANNKISGNWLSMINMILEAGSPNTQNTTLQVPNISAYSANQLKYANSLYNAVASESSGYISHLNSVTDSGNGKRHEGWYNNMLSGLSRDTEEVLYVVTHVQGDTGDYKSDIYFFQLFYDFEVEPLSNKFVSAVAKENDTLQDLENKGIIHSLNTTSGSNSKINVFNTTEEYTTVSKGFEYTQSETISTETSHSYSEHLGGSSSLAVKIGFKIPVFGGADSDVTVSQTIDYFRDITDTYTSGTQVETSMTSSDTIQLTLPPHTTSEILLSNYDATTGIPYTGASTVRYKTMIIYFGAEARPELGNWDLRDTVGPKVITFGDSNKGFSAVEDLDNRIVSAGPDYDKDGLDDLMLDPHFIAIADNLRYGQPYAPYSGFLKYAVKTTNIIPGAIQPLYAAQEFLVDTDRITMYDDQSVSAKTITVEAYNQYGVAYYGFSQRLHGTWAIVDASGNPNSEYAELQYDVNGYAEVVAKKATGGAKIYLTYVPTSDKFVSLADNYVSEKIPIEIKTYPVSMLRIVGDMGSFILDPDSNTANVSGITVRAQTEDDHTWQTITGSPSIEWYVEEYDGIEVSKSGAISFTKAGTYQIYARANGQESNRLVLTVTPERQLAELKITGTINTLYWDGTPNTFDLSGLSVTGTDNYGDPFTDLSSIIWMSTNEKAADVSGSTLIAQAVGQGTVTAKVGSVYSDSHISFAVKDAPYPVSLKVVGNIPELVYDDPAKSSYNLTDLSISAADQYGNDYSLDPSLYEWVLEKGDGSFAKVENNTLTGLVIGEDKLMLRYPTTDPDAVGGYLEFGPIDVKVKALPYIKELYYNGGAEIAREGISYDMQLVPLIAKDQYGQPIAPPAPSEITWAFSALNEASASVSSRGYLVVTDVPQAGEVIAMLEGTYNTNIIVNVPIKVRQQAVLTKLEASMEEGFALKINENANLADHFTVVGYDQYGDVIAASPTWVSSEPAAVSLVNGVLRALQEDAETLIYAEQGSVKSNEIPFVVRGVSRVSSVTVKGAPAAVELNDTLDLKDLTVSVFDQYDDQFTEAELEEYPATIRWNVVKGATNARISGDELLFGDVSGQVTLVCTIVNKSSQDMADTHMVILVGEPFVESISPAQASMSSSGGNNVITLKGLNLEDGITVAAFDKDGDPVSGITATTTGTGKSQTATLKFPANTSTQDDLVYTVKFSLDGVAFEDDPVCTVTVVKAFGGGGIGPGTGGTTIEDDDTPTSGVVVHEAYISGYPDGTFMPDRNVTRAEAANMLFKLMEDTSKVGEGFGDVKPGDWYYEAVMALSGAGIINGYSDGTFRPSNTVTRAEFVAMVIRFAKATGAGSVSFSDVPTTHWAYNLIVTAVGNGYVLGYPDGTFVPEGFITRAEAVTIINRVLECDYRGEGKSFSDVPASHWAYFDIIAAATDHEHTP